jgi:hypothetical protein
MRSQIYRTSEAGRVRLLSEQMNVIDLPPHASHANPSSEFQLLPAQRSRLLTFEPKMVCSCALRAVVHELNELKRSDTSISNASHTHPHHHTITPHTARMSASNGSAATLRMNVMSAVPEVERGDAQLPGTVPVQQPMQDGADGGAVLHARTVTAPPSLNCKLSWPLSSTEMQNEPN